LKALNRVDLPQHYGRNLHDPLLNAIAPETLTALIVDDEALARRGLTLRLEKISGIKVIGEARNGREALKAIKIQQPDIVFLDIQMPGMSGFDVIRELGQTNPAVVIFVTAFDQFAIQAFEANAVAYILKPIEDERLDHALRKAREIFDQRNAVAHKKSLLELVSQIAGETVSSMEEISSKTVQDLKHKETPRLAIRDGGHTTWVKQADIEWIDAAGDYMCVHALGETHIMRKTMKELEQALDENLLQRIHRSTIVNVNQVREMQSHINGEYFLTLQSGHTLKLSRTYKDKLKFFR
jgi:two-component system LytT family response regulator